MLNVVSLNEALKIIDESAKAFDSDSETVKLSDSVGRVLFKDVFSKEDVPSFNRSTVDGFAVKAADTFGSSESMPAQLNIVGEILMGEEAELKIKDGECVRISTGGMLPEGADSVVMVENTDCTFNDFCLILGAVSPCQNVIKKAEDLKTGQLILKKGTLLSSKHIGVLAALGVGSVEVFKKLRVGIISTGDELVAVEEELKAGKIRDVNTHLLMALSKEMGCIGTEYGIIDDSFDEIFCAVKKAVNENDIVLISGGSSAGVKDMTVKVISALGKVHFHGIALKPGKPTIFGTAEGKAVFGLPGNPGAAFYVTLLTVKHLVNSVQKRDLKEKTVLCRISRNVPSNHGREEVVSVRIEKDKAVPVFSKSGFVSVLSECDGYIIVERNSEGLKENDTVEVHLF